MCGITCIVSPRSRPLARLVAAMTDAIAHRGPDGEGFLLVDGSKVLACHGPATPPAAMRAGLPWSPEQALAGSEQPAQVALGHRRLAIIEPSALGHQPMCDENRLSWITYNGEIYNHVELRAELEALGHRFRSHSDTEVILAAYAQWGADCLRRFNGMWAFVIVDLRTRTLFAARDRFGVKPLYYRRTGAGIAFASEIKAFAGLDDWRARPNLRRAWDFLVWNVTDHTDETLFDGVYQLPAGHHALLPLDAEAPRADGSGRLPVTAWYALRAQQFTGSLQEATSGFRDLLTDSVRLRLRSDVAVGSCLSGGLDSSTLVCLMHGMLGGSAADQWTFSACSDVAAVDESRWIDEVVRATGVRSERVSPGVDGLFRDMRSLAWHQDEPFGSSSIYAQWCVFRLAREHGVKVLLDGQGADEQLAGYHGFMGPRLHRLAVRGRWCALAREARGLRSRLGYSYGHMAQRMGDLLLPEPLRQPLRRIAGRASSSGLHWLDAAAWGSGLHEGGMGAPGRSHSMQALSVSLLTARHLPMLLHWEDRNSMAHGIEARVPFLDWRLVEFTLALPDEHKLLAGVTKRVLREAMKGVLPEPVRRRTDKIGFATPQEVWMRQTATGAFRAALRDAIAASGGLLSPSALLHFDAAVASGAPAALAECWRMVSLGAWMDAHQVGTC